MNKEQLSQRIGNMDDRLVMQAEHVPSYGRQRRSSLRRKIAGIAAVIVLMACSGAVGALAFSPGDGQGSSRAAGDGGADGHRRDGAATRQLGRAI